MKRKVIILPCYIGDTIYFISNGGRGKKSIWEGRVYHIQYDDYYGHVTAKVMTENGFGIHFGEFGKTAFLSREEAEKAFKEMGDE